MRLTNRQQEIIIDEIYEQVSEPIIEANNKALDSVKINENDQYLLDCAEYDRLEKEENRIESLKKDLANKYYQKTFNGFEFGYSPMYKGNRAEYINYLKSSQVILLDTISKTDIEKELILAGNKDIPELIETIVAKFKK
jgi:hypothetical protein